MPDMQIQSNLQAFNLGGSMESQQADKTAHGSYRGQQVSAPTNMMSLLADAAEELTFTAAETQEKKVAERKKEEVRRSDDPSELMAQRLQNMQPENLKKFQEQVAQAGKDPKKLKDLALKQFSGHGEQHLALSYAMEMAERAGDTELASALKTAIDELEQEFGAEIRADYNTDSVDAGAVGGTESGRSLYRGTVLGHADVGEAFLAILDQHGIDGFNDALAFLRKAIGADLSSQTSSIEKSELEQSNKDLAHVQMMANIYQDCDKLLQTLAKRHGVDYN